jgi:hypothetical protein
MSVNLASGGRLQKLLVEPLFDGPGVHMSAGSLDGFKI